eukprot:103043_1
MDTNDHDNIDHGNVNHAALTLDRVLDIDFVFRCISKWLSLTDIHSLTSVCQDFLDRFIVVLQQRQSFFKQMNHLHIGIMNLNQSWSMKQCLEYHCSRATDTHYKHSTKANHYLHVKIIELILFYEFISVDKIEQTYYLYEQQSITRWQLVRKLFEHDHGIPAVKITIPRCDSDNCDETCQYFVNRNINSEKFSIYLTQIITQTNQYMHTFKIQLDSMLRKNNKEARKLNVNIAVTLNKKIANKLYTKSYIHNKLKFRNNQERLKYFDEKMCELDEYITQYKQDEKQLEEKIVKLQKENTNYHSQMRTPHLANKLRKQLKIRIAQNRVKIKRFKRQKDIVLKNIESYDKRKKTTEIRNVLQKMNSGGKGRIKHITSQCIKFCELLLEKKRANLDADERRKVDRLNLHPKYTNTEEIVYTAYLYAATCRHSFIMKAFDSSSIMKAYPCICSNIFSFIGGFGDFTMDPANAFVILISNYDVISTTVLDVVEENIFTISRQTVSELGDKGNSRTRQARKCRARGTAKWTFVKLYKVLMSKLHPNYKFCREILFQSYERVARLIESFKEEMVMYGMDGGAIRRFGTHEGNNSAWNKKRGTLKDDIGTHFGLPTSSVYYHPSTYIRPIDCVIAGPIYDDTTGETSRCGEYRDQYLIVAPKTVQYGSALDMANIKEMVFCTMNGMVDDEKRKLKDGAIDWKSHTLKINKDNFTYENYTHQISLLKWLTRARLLAELY